MSNSYQNLQTPGLKQLTITGWIFVFVLAAAILITWQAEQVSAASADPVDQAVEDAPGQNLVNQIGIGQSFTAGKTGYIYDLDLSMYQPEATSSTIGVQILEGGTMAGKVLGSTSLNSSSIPLKSMTWMTVTFKTGIYVEKGRQYTITLKQQLPVKLIAWNISVTDIYAGGKSINSVWEADFGFRTYVATTERIYSTDLSVPSSPGGTYGQTITLTSTLNNAGSPLPSQPVAFKVDGMNAGTALTNSSGIASISYPLNLMPGDHTVAVSYAGDGTYLASDNSYQLKVLKADLTVKPDNMTRTYGDDNPAFTATYSGLAAWDTPASISGLTLSTAANSSSDAGSYSIVASGINSAYYAITYNTATLMVTPAPLTVQINNAARIYGDANPTFTGQIAGQRNGDVIAASYESAASNPASNVGSYPITATLSGSKLSNYTISSNPGTLTVTKAPLTITVHNSTRVYGNSNPVFTSTIVGVKNNDQLTIRYATTANQFDKVGTYPVSAWPTGTNADNYNSKYIYGEMTVTPAPLTVITNDAARVYGDANPLFSGKLTGVRGSDAITVTYETIADPASEVGSYPITAKLTAPYNKLDNYAITNSTGALTITKAALNVSVNDATRIYGDENPLFSSTVTGLKNDDSIKPVYSTSAAKTSNVGTYPIVAKWNESDPMLENYEMNVTPGTLTVTKAALSVSVDDATRVYGEENPAFAYTVTGQKNGDSITVTYSTPATEASHVGTYSIIGSLDEELSNYNVTFSAGTLTVTKATLLVSVNDAARMYGDENPAFTSTLSGLKNSDSFSPVYSTNAVKTSDTGTYDISASIGGSTNYEITITPGTLTITKAALSISVNDAIRVYGDENPLFSGQVTGLKNGDSFSPVYSTTAIKDSDAGTYTITASLGVLTNYEAFITPGTLSITKAPLSITVNNATRVYGDENPTFTGTVAGLRNGDSFSPVYTTSASKASNTGTYNIIASIMNSKNYEVSITPGMLTITKAALSISVNDATRVYGDKNPVFTGTISGLKNDDFFSAEYSTDAAKESNAGSYTITAALADAGNIRNNYEVTVTPGTLIVTKAIVTVSGNDATRVYGNENPAFSGTVTGLKNGDALSPVYSTTAVKTSSVGTYKITASLDDDDSKLSNYEVTFVPGTLTISKAALTVSVNAKTRVYGEDNPVFTSTVTGLKNGNSFSPTYSTTAAKTSNVGSYNITATINDADNKLSNYEITVVPGTLTVTKAALILSVNDATRVYGDDNPAFTGTVTGLKNGDAFTPDYTTTTNKASNVGTYGITATITDNKLSNYEITVTPGTLTVTKAHVTVTPDDRSRWTNQGNPELTGQLNGLVNNDSITVRYTTEAQNDSKAGQYLVAAELTDPSHRLDNYEVVINKAYLTVYAPPLPDFGQDDYMDHVTKDLKLASADEANHPIKWTSSDMKVIDPLTGRVSRPSFTTGNVEVTLQASVEANGTTYTVTYQLTVLAAGMTDEEAVARDKNNVSIGYTDGDNESLVQKNVKLPTQGANGTTITWTSSNKTYLDPLTGQVTLPSYQTGNLEITLDAAIAKGDAVQHRTFKLVIKARTKPAEPSTNLYIEFKNEQGLSERIAVSTEEAASGVIRITTRNTSGQFVLSAELLKQLSTINPDFTIIVGTPDASMTIPSSAFKTNGETMFLTLRQAVKSSALQAVLAEKDPEVIAGPLLFEAGLMNGNGEIKLLETFPAYTERRISLGSTKVSPTATGVLWDEEENRFIFVPTRFVTENGKTIAILQTRGTGVYLILDQPVSFSDTTNHWAKQNVELLASKLIIQGTGEDRFGPNAGLTRAETAALLVRALGLDSSADSSAYSDVQGQWYAEFIAAASEAGLVTGYSDGTFRPNDKVTREELAVMISRALAIVNSPSKDNGAHLGQMNDKDNVSSWAADASSEVISLGIVKGDEQGNFRPQDTATRAEMATMLLRMLQYLEFI